jgi:hypothetical protein
MSERSNVVMRFSEEGDRIYTAILKHAEECAHCRSFTRGQTGEVAGLVFRFGCVGGVILAQQWKAEYERLHSPEERATHDRMAAEHGVDFVAKAIRAAGQKRGGDA